jgi:hypothetical protein
LCARTLKAHPELLPGLPLPNAKPPILTRALLQPNASAPRALVVAVLAALALATPARAHVSVRPALLPSGTETTLTIEIPGLRRDHDPNALTVSGPGVRMLSSRPAGRLGQESRWLVRVRVETEPGPLPLELVARYPDGESVPVLQTLTVVPAVAASGQGPGSGAPVLAIAVALAALLAVVGVLFHFRKKSRAAC